MMKYSKQREWIYQTVLRSGGHLTAEDVFGIVRGKFQTSAWAPYTGT